MPRYITNKKQNNVAEFTGSLNGDVVGPQNNTQIGPGIITNANINANAAITDTKLATIASSGKVANSATTATPTNTNNTIVSRSSSGEVAVSKLYGDLNTTGTTLNIGAISANTINLGTANTTQIVNVGTGSGTTTINLGGAGDTVNIAESLTYVNTTNLEVADSQITINKNDASGSGGNAGIYVEEAGNSASGYVAVNSTRDSWQLTSPSTAGIINLSPGSGFTINQGSHNPVTIGTANGLTLSTQQISMATANTSTIGALTSTDWNTFNTASTAVAARTSLATPSTIMARDVGGNTAVHALSITPGGNLQNALSILSGNSANYVSLGLGRTAPDLEIGISSQGGNFTSDTGVGDIVIRHNDATKLLRFATGSATSMIVGNSGVVSTSIGTGSVIISGGLGVSGNITSSMLSTGDVTSGNLTLSNGAGYKNISMGGENSSGYLFGYFPTLGDGIHLSYNNAYINSSTLTIPNTAGATSRVTSGYGFVGLCAGAVNSAPTEYLRVNNSAQILAQNSATFVGPLTGNVTGNVIGSTTQIKSNNGAVSTNNNPSPTAAGMTLTSTSTTDAKWDYPAPLTCFRSSGYFSTSSSTMAWVDNIASALPASGNYLVTFWCPNFTNTNNGAYNNFELRQSGIGATITYTIPANNPTKLWELKSVFNFSTTGALSLYGSTSTGTATFDQFYFTLTKINQFS